LQFLRRKKEKEGRNTDSRFHISLLLYPEWGREEKKRERGARGGEKKGIGLKRKRDLSSRGKDDRILTKKGGGEGGKGTQVIQFNLRAIGGRGQKGYFGRRKRGERRRREMESRMCDRHVGKWKMGVAKKREIGMQRWGEIILLEE